MNDFTKEELENIFGWIDDCGFLSHEQELLHIKIKFMIDNYCDHDNSVSVGLHNLCNKCGHIQ